MLRYALGLKIPERSKAARPFLGRAEYGAGFLNI